MMVANSNLGGKPKFSSNAPGDAQLTSCRQGGTIYPLPTSLLLCKGSYMDSASSSLETTAARSRPNRLMWTGLALMFFGAVAIAAPAIAGKAVMIVIGAVLLVSGVVEVVHALREESLSSKLITLVLGVITAMAGLAVLAHPVVGMTVLALVLAIFFLIEGVAKMIASFSYRPASGWMALFLSGLAGFLLGFMIWRQWPLSGLWAVGILLGVDLLMTGASLLALGMTIRQLKDQVTATRSA
jgi:membrane protein HdeD